jgi:hypothetical protein
VVRLLMGGPLTLVVFLLTPIRSEPLSESPAGAAGLGLMLVPATPAEN